MATRTISFPGKTVDGTNLNTEFDDVYTLIAEAAPIGATVAIYDTTIPTNWKQLNGDAISRATYSVLYGKLSTVYGVGDGSTTFNLPDMDGIFQRGDSTQSVSGRAKTAAALGTVQEDEFQGHKHTQNAPDGTGGSNWGASVTNTHGTFFAAGPNTTSSTVDDGTNGLPRTGTETFPTNLAVKYIMRVL